MTDYKIKNKSQYISLGLIYGAGIGVSFGMLGGALLGNPKLGLLWGPVAGGLAGLIIGLIMQPAHNKSEKKA